jgi:hypothetical protein
MEILSIAVLELFWTLVGKFTVDIKSEVFNTEVNCSLWVLSEKKSKLKSEMSLEGCGPRAKQSMRGPSLRFLCAQLINK